MSGLFNIWGSDETIKFRFKGTADMDYVYDRCRDWFTEQKFEFHEHFVKAKHPTPVGEEIFWRWTIYRNVTEYIRFQAEIHWHFWDWEPVEVMDGGKKKKLNKGRLIVTIKGHLVTDYKDRFEQNAFKHGLREFLDKYVFLSRLHSWSSFFEYLMHEYQNKLKEWLGMHLHQNAYLGDR